MVKPELEGAISAALNHPPPPSAPAYAQAIALRSALDGHFPPGHPFSQLLDQLRRDPDFVMFGGLMQVVRGRVCRVEHTDLAAWLIERARAASPERAVSDLQRYLSCERLPCRLIVAVAGIKPDGPYALRPGITLVPWEQLPESSTKRSVTERFLFWRPKSPLDSALAQEVEIRRIHLEYTEAVKHMGQPLPLTDLADLLLCLGLFGPTAPVIVSSWLEAPDWAPLILGGFSFGLPEGSSNVRPLSQTAAGDGSKLFETWLALGEQRRAALRVPMHRLDTAMRRRSVIDAAIDLGIALESIFLRDLSDDRGELTFRLRVRGARWLGATPDERRQLFTLFEDLYKTRSKAVHSGGVPSTTRGRPTTELLEEGYKVTARALIALITVGDPDWDAVTLS
ncbi:MAG: hypothetical protein E6K76_08610 [Candidatus Eisenbacteria bacterium]|uniref:Uncharacterized protein n=1 Tax=Eiseniibacteriota bacterium TaxID=2212470 RepID=A0A538T3C2_UNCEI|nr:MAG: hypothetical protein E6K76_08610 [Candidatus Eisenbacteria bacterium]